MQTFLMLTFQLISLSIAVLMAADSSSSLLPSDLDLNRNYRYLDPCKAKGFMGDIALTSDEKMQRLERDALSSTPIPHQKDKSNSGHYNMSVSEERNWWQSYYSTFDLQPYQVQSLMLIRLGGQHRRRKVLRRHKRAATAYKYRTWPHGIIPYFIQANFSSETKATIMKAMRHWENNTCLSFVPKQSHDKSYIIFTEKSCGCCSYVGKRSEDEPQAISIGKNCDKKGIVIHELGHVIGFWHEHTRPDRDDHVEIVLENVVMGQDFNFKKMEPHEVDSLGESYDYQSIMHYAKATFSKANIEWTIRPKACCPRPPIGQRVKLSPGDIRQTKKLYNCPKCGKTLLEYSDKFASPEQETGAVFVPHLPLDCEWKISVTEGELVNLNVTFLHAGSAGNLGGCSDNFVEIRDGIYSNSRLLAKLCHGTNSRTFLSSSSRMWIHYKNTSPTKLTGFKASYQAMCGGELTASEGQIISSNYPEYYKPNKICIWKITVPTGYSIALKFESFKVEKHDTCVYDYLELRDGSTEHAPLLAKTCGYQVPTPIKSSGRNMLLKFVSDSSVEKQGFTATFQKEYDECKTQKHGCQHLCVNTLGGYRCACDIGYELQSNGKSCENACGGVIKKSNGSLHSPNYPGNYPSNKKCVWRIIATDKAKIFLNFTEFDVEGKEKDCQYDYVNIYDGSEQYQKKIGKFCGKKLPQPITSITNELKIAFFSDGTVQTRGFKVYFFTDQNECAEKNGGCDHFCINTIGSYYCRCRQGFQLHGKRNCKEKTGNDCSYEINEAEGEIKSPNHPLTYPPKSDCHWKISTIPGHIIQLTFVDFEIESHQECTYDRLLIYDGPSVKSKQLGRHCGSKTPMPIKSQLNSVLLVFSSDGSVQRRGFKVAFTSVCNGKLVANEQPQVIYSHANYGVPYGKNQQCFWSIETLNEAYSVQLKFLHFEIEPENQCTYDSVKIYDGSSVLAPPIGQYCGTTIPEIITSHSENLLISFISDDTVNAKGFKAEYIAVPKSRTRTRNFPYFSQFNKKPNEYIENIH